MSAAKMVADSTQGDIDTVTSGKRKKSREKKKIKKQKKDTQKKSAKKNSSENENDEDDSDLDLSKELLPIGGYVKDRQEMLSQMFRCLKGASLQRNLPDVLKELPLDDLKQRCLCQLEIMSKKRIKRILAGDDPDSISSSGTEDESSTDEEVQGDDEGQDTKEEEDAGEVLEDNEADSTSQDKNPESITDGEIIESEEELGIDNDDTGEEVVTQEADDEAEEGELRDEETENTMLNEEERMTPVPEDVDTIEQKENEECTGHQSEENSDHYSNESDGQGKGDNSNTESQESEQDIDSGVQGQEEDMKSLAPVLTQNQMELLELEMRARAIKAMLRAQEVREKQLKKAK